MVHQERIWVCTLLIGIALAIAGCSSRTGEPAVKLHRQAFSVDDDITPRTMTITLPSQANLQGPVLSAQESLELAPGAKVLSAPGLPSLAISLGGRPVEIGTGAQIVGLVARPGIQLFANAKVTGNVITSGTVTRESGSSIAGTIQEHAVLDPLKSFAWSEARGTGPIVTVKSDQVTTLQPGTYGSVKVLARGRLKLQSGVYKFSSLYVKSGATVELPPSGRVVVNIFDDWESKGTWLNQTGAGNTLFVFFGDEILLARGFVGTVVASSAQIQLGTGSYNGAFFGKEVLLSSGTVVQHVPFQGWDSVLPPKPFVNCVAQVGPGRFAALFGYENVLDHAVTIPPGPSNNLSPVGPHATLPIPLFTPGREERALWAELVGGELVWQVDGQIARATQLSRACTVDAAYPSRPVTEARGDGPSPPLALKQKPPPYSFVSRVVERPSVNVATSLSGSSGVVALAAPAPAAAAQTGVQPFTISVTRVRYDGPLKTLEKQRLEVETWIEDQHFDRRRVFTCPASACVGPFPVVPPEPYSANLPVSLPVIHVGLALWQDNKVPLVSDDVLIVADLVIDPATGKAISGVAGPAKDRQSPISPADLEGRCVGAGSASLCWSVEPFGPPQITGNTQICANWTAAYVDEGFGEGKQGTPLGQSGLKTYPASFAFFQLNVTDEQGTTPMQGQLDQDGCVPGGFPSQQLVFRQSNPLNFSMSVLAFFSRPTPTGTINYSLSTAIAALPLRVEFTSSDAAQPPFDQWSSTGGAWKIPPDRIELKNEQFTPITNVAATISTMLSAPDTGIADGTYQGVYGDGCQLKEGGVVTSIDSCWNGSRLLIGPATKPLGAPSCRIDSDCQGAQLCYKDPGGVSLSPMPCVADSPTCSCMWPDQSRWKFVTAHEAGHQFQHSSVGSITPSYNFDCPPGQPNCGGERSRFNGTLLDPAFIDERCGCQHVKAANGDHCLQSLERSSGAQVEGFAQFFASRIWNEPTSPSCTFVYYKEFAEQTCAPGAVCEDFFAPNANLLLKSQLPPFPVSCAPPVGGTWFKWRNNYCPMTDPVTGFVAADMGTERDWMGFLYGVNTGPGAATMDDIHMIYRFACSAPEPGQPPAAVPGFCRNATAAWNEVRNRGILEQAGFVQGINLRFSADPIARKRARDLGDAFGVSENLQ